MILTTGYIDHRDIKEYLDVVTANIVSGIGFTSDMVAAVKDFTGGRVSDYERALNDAKTGAMAQLENSASALRADAVMGIRFDVTVFSPHGKGTMIGVTMYGTAVRLSGNVQDIKKPAQTFTKTSVEKPRLGFSEQGTVNNSNIPNGTGFEWGK